MSSLSFSGCPVDDAGAITAFIMKCEASLGLLPSKGQRSEAEQRIADNAHAQCRSLRQEFLRLHGRWVYEEITGRYAKRMNLTELASAASDMVPGLVPRLEQMKMEEGKCQNDKEGREIDQGIFFWGVLRDWKSGAHLLHEMRRPSITAVRLLPLLQRRGRLSLRTVEIERCGLAMHVTIQNPGCLNAEDNQLVEDLGVAVDLTLLDENAHVGVLRGGIMTHPRYVGKRVFSAGINLKDLHSGKISFIRFLLTRELGFISKIMRGLYTEEAGAPPLSVAERKPWIAAVDAFAIGGGAQLLLVCDYIVADADSFIALPAAAEGIIPGAANLRLPRLVSGRLARRMILAGHRVAASSEEAREIIDEVVNAAQIETAVESAVIRLAGKAVRANSTMLNIAEEPEDAFRSYMAEFALRQARRIYDHDVVTKRWERSKG